MSNLDLLVNSNHRVTGVPADYTVSLPAGVEIGPEYSHVSVVQVATKNTIYNINKHNKTLYCVLKTYDDGEYTGNPSISDDYFEAVLDEGNYSVQDIVDTLPGKISEAFILKFENEVTPLAVTVGFDTRTNKFNIQCTTQEYNGAYVNLLRTWFSLRSSNEITANTSLNRTLGFDLITYPDEIGIANQLINFQVAANVHCLRDARVLTLCSDLVQNEMISSSASSSPNALCLVPVASFGASGLQEYSGHHTHAITPATRTQLRFFWRDEDDNAVEWNGGEHQILLRFHVAQ